MNEIIDLLRNLAVQYGLSLLGSIVIVIIGRFVARWLGNVSHRMLERSKVDEILTGFLSNLVYYTLLAIVVIAALNNLGVSTTSVVAIFGAATLAIGLALQDSLGNLAAGVLIILLRPYKVKDYVEIDGSEGYVTEVQLMHTILTTRDSKAILIPNTDVLSNQIVNYSKSDFIRLDLTFGIDYGDDLLQAKKVLYELMKADERIKEEPAADVIVSELGDNSVNLTARPYVLVDDAPGVTAAMTEACKLRFDEEGISFPFPQRDVHFYNQN